MISGIAVKKSNLQWASQCISVTSVSTYMLRFCLLHHIIPLARKDKSIMLYLLRAHAQKRVKRSFFFLGFVVVHKNR